MKEVDDWNGTPVRLAESAGGVLAFADPLSGLIRGNLSVWPTSEIVQKLYKSRQQRAFRGIDGTVATEALGYYCDLQSIHSEDAITWSVFGPISYATPAVRGAYCRDFFSVIDPALPAPHDAYISLWKRVPHPDSLTPGGPEIDFLLRSREVVVLGEAKWLSGVGRAQGIAQNKDQITLRIELFEKYGDVFFPGATNYVVLGASFGEPVVEERDIRTSEKQILLRDVSWRRICDISSHPLSDELSRYYEWKKLHSKSA